MLLLCERTDLPALWACRGLRLRGLEVELVSADALVQALSWEHRLGAAGATIRIELADGRTLQGDRVGGVLNRLVALPAEHLARAAAADREYALQELQALFLSWLAALPGPVLNRPTPAGLCGAWLDPAEWVVLAARAGLRTPPYRRSSGSGTDGPPAAGARHTVLVVAGRTAGAVPEAVAACCLRLAESVGAELLGVELGPGWRFAGATPLPDLSRGGEAALDLLAGALGA